MSFYSASIAPIYLYPTKTELNKKFKIKSVTEKR